MKYFLSFVLLLTPSFVLAEPCSTAPPGVPCTPAPDAATRAAKKNILDFIEAAQLAEPDVRTRKAAYGAVRDRINPPASAQEKLEALEPFRAAQMAQDDLYREAIDQTARLYHVQPKRQDRITIGPPDDPAMNYVAGLSALWNPQVTDSGPGVKLSIRIDGTDGLSHYSGATKMNPFEPNGRQAITTADGKVLILKDTFA